MYIRRGALGWGVFLILAGAIPLAVRGGYLSEAQVSALPTLWPMILIGLGIGLLLGRTRFEFIGGLIVAATFGLIVGRLLSGGMGGGAAGPCGGYGGATAFPERMGTFTATTALFDVELDCGDLTIATGPGTDWRIAGEEAGGNSPLVESSAGDVRILPSDGGDWPVGLFSARSRWQITVPTLPAIDLDLDLSAVRASRELSLEVNAGSVRLCAPVGAGLIQDGSTWTTPGDAQAAWKIDLRTEGNAASFLLDPEEGCDG